VVEVLMADEEVVRENGGRGGIRGHGGE
jgi:hypothetical protein